MEADQAILLHLAQLVGQGAPVHAQIVRQLLAGIRDRKAVTAVPLCLFGEVQGDTLSDRLGSSLHHAGGEGEVFLGGKANQVADDLMVPGAPLLAGGQQFAKVEEQDMAVLGCHYVYQQFPFWERGIGLAKKLPGSEVAEDTASAPIIICYHVDTASGNHAEFGERLSCPTDHFVFVVALFPCLKAG